MIYVFHCPACGKRFEVMQAMNDVHEADCPDCGTKAKRVFFPTADIWKCGCYKKDYANK